MLDSWQTAIVPHRWAAHFAQWTVKSGKESAPDVREVLIGQRL
jgi:hypothetical protein